MTDTSQAPALSALGFDLTPPTRVEAARLEASLTREERDVLLRKIKARGFSLKLREERASVVPSQTPPPVAVSVERAPASSSAVTAPKTTDIAAEEKPKRSVARSTKPSSVTIVLGASAFGYMAAFTVAAFGAAFLPEKITAYETGAKTDWFDKRLRVNLALFHNDWTNLQVNQAITLEGLATPVQVSSNAATAKLTGAEWDIIAKPLDGLTLTSSMTYIPTAEYTNYTTGQANAYIKNLLIQANDPREHGLSTQNTYDASGKRLINVPKTSFIFTAQKDFDVTGGGTLYIRGEYQYTSVTEFDISNNPLLERPAYELLNGSIGYNAPGGHWQFAVWGRNLSDTQYATTISIGSLPTINVGAPRTFGIRLNYAY